MGNLHGPRQLRLIQELFKSGYEQVVKELGLDLCRAENHPHVTSTSKLQGTPAHIAQEA